MTRGRICSRLIRLALIAIAAVLLLNIAEILAKNTKPNPVYSRGNLIAASIISLENRRTSR